MIRKRKIRLALLKLICAADDQGFASADYQLFEDMESSIVRPSPGIAELREQLTAMDREGLLVTVPDGELSRYTPTAKGRAELLKPV